MNRYSHVIGQPGTGKRDTLIRWAVDDVYAGRSIAFLDLLGDAEELIAHIPPERWDDVIYLDASDRKFPFGLNIIAGDDETEIIDTVLDTVKSIWPAKIETPNIDLYFQTATAALLNAPGETLLGIYYILTDAQYRTSLNIKDSIVRHFWKDFEKIPDRERRQATMSTLNKVLQLMVGPTIRNIIGQPKSTVDLSAMERKIVIASFGRLGRKRAKLLATLLLSQFTDRPYSLYLNPVNRFGPAAVMRALDFRQANVILCHRYLAELEEELRDAILGLVPTTIAFRLGLLDTERLERQFPPDQIRRDLSVLPPGVAHARTPHQTLADLHMPATAHRRYPEALKAVRRSSRHRYSVQRKHVEAALKDHYGA
jgi:hypothetical protein